MDKAINYDITHIISLKLGQREGRNCGGASGKTTQVGVQRRGLMRPNLVTGWPSESVFPRGASASAFINQDAGTRPPEPPWEGKNVAWMKGLESGVFSFTEIQMALPVSGSGQRLPGACTPLRSENCPARRATWSFPLTGHRVTHLWPRTPIRSFLAP